MCKLALVTRKQLMILAEGRAQCCSVGFECSAVGYWTGTDICSCFNVKYCSVGIYKVFALSIMVENVSNLSRKKCVYPQFHSPGIAFHLPVSLHAITTLQLSPKRRTTPTELVDACSPTQSPLSFRSHDAPPPPTEPRRSEKGTTTFSWALPVSKPAVPCG